MAGISRWGIADIEIHGWPVLFTLHAASSSSNVAGRFPKVVKSTMKIMPGRMKKLA